LGAHPNLKMKKLVLKSSIAVFVMVGMFFVSIPEAEAQGPCVPNGCWQTITARTGYPAMYCGTCTYIENSRGSGLTSFCYACPGIG